MTWEQIVQQFIDTAPPGLTQGHLNELNAGNVDYATARNIVQQYSLPIAGEMTKAYKQLPANVQGVAFSSTASQAQQTPPSTGVIDPALLAILDRLTGGGGVEGEHKVAAICQVIDCRSVSAATLNGRLSVSGGGRNHAGQTPKRTERTGNATLSFPLPCG